jgi:SAM-dependent methyltransferase
MLNIIILLLVLSFNVFSAVFGEYTDQTRQQSPTVTLLQSLKVPSRAVILDVGCGDGKATAKIAELDSVLRVVGIDPDDHMVSRAQAAHKYVPKMEFVTTSIQEFSEENSYDISTCFMTLHWMSQEQQETSFRNIYRALKSEGELWATLLIEREKPRLNTGVRIAIESEKWREYFKNYQDPLFVAEPAFLRGVLSSLGFQIKRFVLDETTIGSFKNDEEFVDFIGIWSTYRKYFLDNEVLHREFWKDVISHYRRLTNQMEEPINFVDYYLIVHAVKEKRE